MTSFWTISRSTMIGSNEPGDLLGDYNENGTVDAADYVLWRKNSINGHRGTPTGGRISAGRCRRAAVVQRRCRSLPEWLYC